MSPGIYTEHCDALFASDAQPSEMLPAVRLRKVIMQTASALGSSDCAGLVAQEFGDHPETAIVRMRWVREQVDRLFPAEALISGRSHDPGVARIAA